MGRKRNIFCKKCGVEKTKKNTNSRVFKGQMYFYYICKNCTTKSNYKYATSKKTTEYILSLLVKYERILMDLKNEIKRRTNE
jgi:hypothetical protein